MEQRQLSSTVVAAETQIGFPWTILCEYFLYLAWTALNDIKESTV